MHLNVHCWQMPEMTSVAMKVMGPYTAKKGERTVVALEFVPKVGSLLCSSGVGLLSSLLHTHICL